MSGGEMSLAIVGGGIGGLAAALSLLKVSVDVHVYEQAGALTEVGAGIQLSPNATRILQGASVGDTLAETGVKPQAFHQRRWDDGRTLLRTPIAEAMDAAFGFPYYHMHRADVLAALASALPAERLHLGHRFTSLVDQGDRVEAEFENGRRIQVDALVGADGIHSVVRSVLFGAENPRFTGCVAYRGLIPSERLAHLDLEASAVVWMGPGKHFVHYYVRAKRLLNFVAV